MRSETTIKSLITTFAANDERVRAVLLNGSRANPNIKPDNLQDFDIVFIVTSVERFTADHSWTTIFGEKLIFQLPDEMSFGEENNKPKPIGFTYLMLFKDGNRIDLTLFPAACFQTHFLTDSLTVVWLDKDNLFPHPSPPSDIDYHINRPTEKAFADTCNEFWWVSTYVAKGLVRKEITYAKAMLETVVRPMFMKMIEWKIGYENNFSVSFGKAGKLMHKYLTKEEYTVVLQTYSDADIENNWKALFIMAEFFANTSTSLSTIFQFSHNEEEQENTINYLRLLFQKQTN